MEPRFPLWSSALMLVASAASGSPRAGVNAMPHSDPIVLASSGTAPEARAACATVYSSVTAPTYGPYFAGPGKEVIDDLHLTGVGVLCGYGFSYRNESGGPTDAIVTFYANDPSDSRPRTIVAGPFVILGLPGPNQTIEMATAQGSSLIGPDVWMGVSFSTPLTGLIRGDPPTIGASHDLYYQRPEEAYFNFGGSPVANFLLVVDVDSATLVKVSSWGAIKTIYRN